MTRVRSTNSKAEECTTPRIGSRNIKQIQIGVGRWPRIEDSYCCCYSCRVPAILCKPVTLSSLRSVGIHQEWQQVTGKLLLGHSMPNQRKKKYDPSRFSSNFVSVSYLWSNSASPSFKLIRQVFLDLWSLKCHNFYDISVK